MRIPWPIIPLAFTLASTAAQAQVAAVESLQLVETVASPWGPPLGPAMANGSTLRLAPGTMSGPAPLRCPGAKHTFLSTPPEGLFEGNLPEPADRAAQALGMPKNIVTQRTSCANGGFDIHRAADGRAWIGLDNAVLKWERAQLASSPEATVQLLLVQHFATNMEVSKTGIAAQSGRLTPALVDKFNRWFARTANSDEAPELDGDPFTDSQEPPAQFELAPAKAQGARAELVVTYRSEGRDPYEVRFELVRVQNTWLVDDLRLRGEQRLTQLLAK